MADRSGTTGTTLRPGQAARRKSRQYTCHVGEAGSLVLAHGNRIPMAGTEGCVPAFLSLRTIPRHYEPADAAGRPGEISRIGALRSLNLPAASTT